MNDNLMKNIDKFMEYKSPYKAMYEAITKESDKPQSEYTRFDKRQALNDIYHKKSKEIDEKLISELIEEGYIDKEKGYVTTRGKQFLRRGV